MERVKASESDLIEKFKTEKRIEHAQNGAAKRNRKRMRERDRKNAVDVSKITKYRRYSIIIICDFIHFMNFGGIIDSNSSTCVYTFEFLARI